MVTFKSIKNLSVNITEDEYRKMNAMHYSMLSRFIEGGFESIDHLDDPLSTPSLTFGKMVDLMISNRSAFNDVYAIIEDKDMPSDKTKEMMDYLADIYGNCYDKFADIPEEFIENSCQKIGYRKTYLPKTRYSSLDKYRQYYELINFARKTNKTLVTQSERRAAIACYNALLDSKATKEFFKEDLFEANRDIERVYQLKFISDYEHNGHKITFKVMPDLLIVDHKAKTVRIIDQKTSSFKEYKFPLAFVKFNYQIQARLYYRVIRDVLARDEYFKDFTFLPFQFVVINRDTLNPLIWTFDSFDKNGTLSMGKTSMRDPYDIAEELDTYLHMSADERIVPIGVSLEHSGNSIENWFEKEVGDADA